MATGNQKTANGYCQTANGIGKMVYSIICLKVLVDMVVEGLVFQNLMDKQVMGLFDWGSFLSRSGPTGGVIVLYCIVSPGTSLR